MKRIYFINRRIILKRFNIVMLLIVLVFVVGGCAKPAAEVNGEKISRKLFELVLKEKLAQHTKPGMAVDEAHIRKSVIDQLIAEKLLLQAAGENHISLSDKEFNKRYSEIVEIMGRDKYNAQLQELGISEDEYKARVRNSMTIDKYIRSHVTDDSVTEEEAISFYKDRGKPFITPERVMVRIIQLRSEEHTKQIDDGLRSGKTFDKVAEDAEKKGIAVVSEYGWTQPAVFSGDIQKAMKDLKKGAFGGPYKGKEGYYFLRVKDREKERPKTFEESRNDIKAFLLQNKRETTALHLIEEMKKKAAIKIHIN